MGPYHVRPYTVSPITSVSSRLPHSGGGELSSPGGRGAEGAKRPSRAEKFPGGIFQFGWNFPREACLDETLPIEEINFTYMNWIWPRRNAVPARYCFVNLVN
jgi:hypothetical protein